ncbi:MAG: anti-sigma factor family protein [Thiotrichales bacterium]
MTDDVNQFSDSEIHAYIDDQLDHERAAELLLAMADDPELEKRVNDYIKVNALLKAELDPILSESLPDGIREQLKLFKNNPVKSRDWQPFLRAAMVAGVLLFSGGIGWTVHSISMSHGSTSLVKNNLVEPATFAHAVFAPDANRPVEIFAGNVQLLNRWLTNRMGTPITAPDLSLSGLKLLGGRLLPSTDRMAAQFMYENDTGSRVTVYIRRIDNGESSVDYADIDGVDSYFWTSDGFGVAVSGRSGQVTRDSLLNASEQIYRSGWSLAKKESAMTYALRKMRVQIHKLFS